MSEIKGIDQIFPKKADNASAASNLKLWAVAGVVALLAAGYALVPAGSASPTAAVSKSGKREPVVASPVSEAKPLVGNAVPKSAATAPVPAPVVVEDIRTARQLEAKKQKQQQAKTEISQSRSAAAAEVKAPTKASSRSCDCETAELNLPAECPDASCRQCKATCGIPGNNN